MTHSTWTRERIHFWLKVLVPVFLSIGLIWGWGSQVAAVISPFLVSFLLAYVFNPVVIFLGGRSRNEYRMRRILAVILLYLAWLVFALIIFLILAKVVEELFVLSERIPEYGEKIYDLLEKYVLVQLDRVNPDIRYQIKEQLDPENLKNLYYIYVHSHLNGGNLAQGVGTAVKGFTGFVRIAFDVMISSIGQILGGVGNAVTFVSSATLTLVITFYLLLDYDRLRNKITQQIPEAYRQDTLVILRRIDLHLSGFLRGQLMICISVGTFVSIGLAMVGVDYALMIGVVAGLFNIIPYLGPVMGAVPAVIVTILEEYQPIALNTGQVVSGGTDWGHLLIRVGIVMGVFVIVQMLDSFLISPKVMGDKLDLHPMIILFALLLGGALFGLVGMLIAVPFACIVRVLIERVYFPARDRIPDSPWSGD